MTRNTSAASANQPAERVQRRPTDAIWFGVLIASVAMGIGMTIFAPVGDDRPRAGQIGVTTTGPAADPFIAPATTTTLPATTPSTARSL